MVAVVINILILQLIESALMARKMSEVLTADLGHSEPEALPFWGASRSVPSASEEDPGLLANHSRGEETNPSK